jgi:Tol biopolymer transport system component
LIRPLALAVGIALVASACAGPVPGPTTSPTTDAPSISGTPTVTPSPTRTRLLTPTVSPSLDPTDAPTASLTARPTIGAADLDGVILFDHGFDIWQIAADGSQRTRLTDDPAQELDATWSPDGSLIAFRYHAGTNEEVFVMNADGSGVRNLTQNPASDYSPAWSPDGSQIAFASDRGPDSGGNDIWVVNVDGTELRRLTHGGGIDEYPTWSPDGSRIAYACSGGRILADGTADFEVCVMDVDGDDRRQLTDAPGLSDYPAWSPDGRQIAFMSTRGGWPTLPDYVPPAYEPGSHGEYDIYVMDADGGNVRNVTNNGREDEQFPGWSPDGGFLVFSRYGCLVAAAADGSAESVLSTPNELCEDGFPDWRASSP